MNRIDVIINRIASSGGIMLADLRSGDIELTALLIDTVYNPVWLFEGNDVYAVFKETEVSIAKNFAGLISLRNKIPCTIDKIERGELMSLVKMSCGLVLISSAITTRSVDALALQTGDAVTAMIKANEVTLIEKC
jgi:molybdate transport system regulatory protein